VVQVLLVEDDAAIRSALIRGLNELGHAVASAPTAMGGLEQAVSNHPDLVVLDLGLPDVDGTTMLRMLRGTSSVPVIVATARDDETVIVAVLDAGADDYLVKPFSAAQLDARIRAVLRRSGGSTGDPTLEVGELRLNPRSRQAALDGSELDLTPREFDLLHYLVAHSGEVISRRELLSAVWQLPLGGSDKTVDVHLSWLRRKLGETAHGPRYIHSVRGVGVRLSAPKD
jgi:DNA-binding response OmpR family regulator